jgi:predicted alpha/beta hydrolase
LKFDAYVLNARDGFPLAVNSYRPPAPRYRLLINSATGIPKDFYQHFARHAAKRGAWVLTFDYRGIAGSRAPGWQGAAPCMSDWGRLDLASLIDHASDELPLALLGHSVGGQLPGLADNLHRVKALLGVAAQSGYWRLWPATKQARLGLTWYALVPLLARALGQLPGRFMGGETLPRGVALEWARWCRSPHYMSDAQGAPLRPHFADLRAPARFLCFSDDQAIAPERAVRALAGFYSGTAVQVQMADPAQWQMKSLGHFGFFRRQTPLALWDAQLNWLEQALEAPPLRQAA